MFSVHFDSNDSFICRGQTYYFNKEENIEPFIKSKITPKILNEINENYLTHYNSVEELFKDKKKRVPILFGNISRAETVVDLAIWELIYINKIETID